MRHKSRAVWAKPHLQSRHSVHFRSPAQPGISVFVVCLQPKHHQFGADQDHKPHTWEEKSHARDVFRRKGQGPVRVLGTARNRYPWMGFGVLGMVGVCGAGRPLVCPSPPLPGIGDAPVRDGHGVDDGAHDERDGHGVAHRDRDGPYGHDPAVRAPEQHHGAQYGNVHAGYQQSFHEGPPPPPTAPPPPPPLSQSLQRTTAWSHTMEKASNHGFMRKYFRDFGQSERALEICPKLAQSPVWNQLVDKRRNLNLRPIHGMIPFEKTSCHDAMLYIYKSTTPRVFLPSFDACNPLPLCFFSAQCSSIQQR